MNLKKLYYQILRLCEKQYRKGFQQGFYACQNNQITAEQVNKWRADGAYQGYAKMIDPLNHRNIDAHDQLFAESWMGKTDEIRQFFNEQKAKL
jgi:hypothetical protein